MSWVTSTICIYTVCSASSAELFIKTGKEFQYHWDWHLSSATSAAELFSWFFSMPESLWAEKDRSCIAALARPSEADDKAETLLTVLTILTTLADGFAVNTFSTALPAAGEVLIYSFIRETLLWVVWVIETENSVTIAWLAASKNTPTLSVASATLLMSALTLEPLCLCLKTISRIVSCAITHTVPQQFYKLWQEFLSKRAQACPSGRDVDNPLTIWVFPALLLPFKVWKQSQISNTVWLHHCGHTVTDYPWKAWIIERLARCAWQAWACGWTCMHNIGAVLWNLQVTDYRSHPTSLMS